MRRIILILPALLLMAPGLAPAAMAAMPTDTFVYTASQNELLKTESSRYIAAQTNIAPDVRAMAEDNITAHDKVSAELEDAASAAGVELAVAASLDAPHAAKLNQLKGMPPYVKEAAYVELQQQTNQNIENAYHDYATAGPNPDLRDFASEQLPEAQVKREQIKRMR